MSDTTRIEWTDATWNPVRGCSIVSKGCTNCYAMRQAHRHNRPGGAYEGLTMMSKGGPVWNGATLALGNETLLQPWRWNRPRRVFVNSMSDLFHESLDFSQIDRIFAAMALAPQHTYQVLTKRPARMLAYMLEVVAGARPLCQRATELRNSFVGGLMVGQAHGASTEHLQAPFRPWPFLWLGVSVEDQAAADERIPLLLRTPAAVRWISAEPLLGPLRVADIGDGKGGVLKPLCGLHWQWTGTNLKVMGPKGPQIDWVVAGGESGPGARPMHPDWARALRDQCAAAGVAFFFKQWGSWTPCLDTGKHVESPREKQIEGAWLLNVGKKSAGRHLDGRTHEEYPR